MRQHPVYIIACLLFAIALEVILVARWRRRSVSAREGEEPDPFSNEP